MARDSKKSTMGNVKNGVTSEMIQHSSLDILINKKKARATVN